MPNTELNATSLRFDYVYLINKGNNFAKQGVLKRYSVRIEYSIEYDPTNFRSAGSDFWRKKSYL